MGGEWLSLQNPSAEGLGEGSWRLLNLVRVTKGWVVKDAYLYFSTTCDPFRRGTPRSAFASGYIGDQRPALAFDGVGTTSWRSQCADCPAAGAFLGVRLAEWEDVRCIRFEQSEEHGFYAKSVKLEHWDTTNKAWKEVQRLLDLRGGTSRAPSPGWPRLERRPGDSGAGFRTRGAGAVAGPPVFPLPQPPPQPPPLLPGSSGSE